MGYDRASRRVLLTKCLQERGPLSRGCHVSVYRLEGVAELDERGERGESAINRLVKIRDSLDSLTAEQGSNDSQLLAAYGWWSRIVRTAQAIALLHRAGLAHEASPLVRANLHHSIALQWLIACPDEALPALWWEHQSKGHQMLKRASEGSWGIGPDLVWDPPADEAPEGCRYLQSMALLCEKMGIPDAYVAFLAESKLTHPTAFSADVYVTKEQGRIVLLRDPGFSASLSGVALVAADSTAQFAALAHLGDVEREATQLAKPSALPGSDCTPAHHFMPQAR